MFQVHKTALMASGKRLKELELHLAEQLKKKQQHRSQISIVGVSAINLPFKQLLFVCRLLLNSSFYRDLLIQAVFG